MKKITLTIIFIFMISPFLYNVLFAAERLKIATLAPPGSTWYTGFIEMGRDITNASNGKYRLKVYGAGIQGTEFDVLKKIRTGQLHGGAFTGPTLGLIVPDIRIMELPSLFKSYDEVDNTWKQIRSLIENQFYEKGYIFLAYLELGFVNIFTNQRISDPDDIKKLKMWIFQGDPLSSAMAKALNVAPIPLQINDVRTSLQTGMINACYTSPVGAIAMQWFSKVRYQIEPPITYSAGALVFSRDEWHKIPSQIQKIIKDSALKMEKETLLEIREENINAQDVLRKNGIEVNSFPPEKEKEIEELSSEIWKKMAGNLYSKEILDQVMKNLSKFRSQ